jgi:ornithine carbamoyltransferase
MGQEAEAEARKAVFRPYQVNRDLFARAKPDALFMHCLPAHRGEEVTDEVIDSEHSVVFPEAENRLHVEKAIMYELLRD